MEMTDALIKNVARALAEMFEPDTWPMWMDEARAALAAIDKSGTHVVVPVSPTFEMIDNAAIELTRMMKPGDMAIIDHMPSSHDMAALFYRSLLAARPKVTP